ncbi:hypothetical protein ASD65_11110 [Microbacterium sp. Root61]|nr:hypothetical protein ASD65_11110 [Microbacterium sp. Root61]
MSSYLALFYTDAVGISASVAGLIILGARLLDGIFDAAVGAVSERTRSRWGRFRPWIMFGALPLGVFAALTFTAPFPGDTAAAVIWAVVTYGVCGLVYSIVNVPYAALSGVMAETPADRVSMNSMRFALGSIGLVATSVVTLPLVGAFGGSSGTPISIQGFTFTAAMFAVIAVILFFVTYRTSRETVKPVRTDRVPFKETLSAIFTNGPLFLVAVLTILGGVAFYSRLGVIVYYYIYSANAAPLVPLLIPLSPVAALVGSLVFSRFARRIGKRNLFIIGMAVQVVALTALFFVDPANLGVVIVLTVVHGLSGFTIPLTYSMVADAADYGEYKSGVRADGISFALVSIAQKLAFAVGGASVLLIGIFGYQPNVQQTSEALQGINFVVNLFPAIIGLIAILTALAYRITDAQAAQIRTDLNTGTIAVAKATRRG